MADSRIGVENVVFSKVLTDTSSETTYDTPWSLGKKTIKISVGENSGMEQQYADDQSVEVYVEDGDIPLGMDVTDFTEDELALLYGQTMVNGIRSPSSSDVRPYWSVSFKSKKKSGSYKYYKILKTMFKGMSSEHNTKLANATPQTDSIEGVGIQRISDGLRKRVADEDASSYVSTVGSAWFTTGDVDPTDHTP